MAADAVGKQLHLPALCDEELAVLARGGEEAAFAELVGRYEQRLYRLAYRLVGANEAEDVAQDAFIKIYRALGSFRPEERFSTWAYRIASNCAIDRLRRRRSMISLDAAGGTEAEDLAGNTGWSEGPEAQALDHELAAEIARAVASLPPTYRLLIVLRHYHHLNYEEIAAATGLPMGTIKNRLFRARQVLSQQLRHLEPGDDGGR